MNIAVSVGDALGPPSEALPRVRVWVLLGDRTGDNAQLLRLAEALGWPFEAKRIRYNRLNRCPNLLLGASTLTVDTRGSDPLAPPWPDLVIGASRRAAGALDQEAIRRSQPIGAAAARSGALALFRFGGDHPAIPPA